jgi:excisionase family DNA binding protein
MSENTALTPREVATRLGVSVPTVYRLIHSGQLEAKRIGVNTGVLRVLESDLLLYLDKCTIRPPAPQKKETPAYLLPINRKRRYFS